MIFKKYERKNTDVNISSVSSFLFYCKGWGGAGTMIKANVTVSIAVTNDMMNI